MKFEIRKNSDFSEFWFREGCYIQEIAADEGDGELSIARARVLPGSTTAHHALKDVNERYLVVSGMGRIEIGDDFAEDVGPGDVVRIPAGSKQRITNTGDDDLIFYAICTPPFTEECYMDLEEKGDNE